MIVLDEHYDDPDLRFGFGWYPGQVMGHADLGFTGKADPNILQHLPKGAIFVTENTVDFWRRVEAPAACTILCLPADHHDLPSLSRLVRGVLRLGPYATRRRRGGLVIKVIQEGGRPGHYFTADYRRLSDRLGAGYRLMVPDG
jgi:hypothetical protein